MENVLKMLHCLKLVGSLTLFHPAIVSELGENAESFSPVQLPCLPKPQYRPTATKNIVQLIGYEPHEFSCNAYSKTAIFVDIFLNCILFWNLGNKELSSYDYKFL